MSEERAKISAKIRALLSKTMENGATEAEAMSAAEKASELMTEYDLTMHDVQAVKDDTWGKRTRPFGEGSSRRRHYHEVSNVMSSIARFCDCKVWLQGAEATFFGTKDDTDIAWFMTDMIRAVSEQVYREYTNSVQCALDKLDGAHGKSLRANFMIGFMSRVGARLSKMKQERDTKVATTGTELVVVKAQELARRYAELGLRTGTRGGTAGSRNTSAGFSAGASAGDRVNLGARGVEGSRKQIN